MQTFKLNYRLILYEVDKYLVVHFEIAELNLQNNFQIL